jgi:hypothetical protein
MVGFELSNYDYPYPVHFYPKSPTARTQNEVYGCVSENYNGKILFAFHGKNFNEPIAKRLLLL